MSEPAITEDFVRRRQAARALGLPLGASWAEIEAARARVGYVAPQPIPAASALAPASVVIEHIERPPTEKPVQKAVYDLYTGAGCAVYWLSQARRTGQTAGLPDLYVFHEAAGASWWHEVKPPTGDLSDAQREFQQRCAKTLTRHVTGGEEAARRMLAALGIPLP